MVFDNKGKLAPAILDAFCREYFTVITVNVEEDRYEALHFAPWMKQFPDEGCFSDFVNEYVKSYVTGVSKHELWQALLLSEIHTKFDGAQGDKNEYRLGASNDIDYSSFRYGENHWCRCTIRPLEYNEDGKIRMVLVLLQDITEKKNVEIRSRERENAAVLALCSDYTAAFVCDLKKNEVRQLKFNDKAHSTAFATKINSAAFPYSLMIKHYYHELLIKESSPDFKELFDANHLMDYLETHKYFVSRHKTKPNPAGYSYFELKVVKLFSDDDSYNVIMGFRPIDDIVAKEKQRRAMLRETKHTEIISALSTLFEEIAVVNLEDMTYDFVSDISRYGKKHGVLYDVFDSLVVDCVHPDHRKAVEEFSNLKTLPERLKDKNYLEIHFRNNQGNWNNLIYIAKKRDDSGNVISILVALRDIDELKKKEIEYQEQLKTAKMEAERANEAKTNFLRRMSHDIRTPINGIRGLVQMSYYYYDDLERINENRAKVMSSTDHLLSLVNDILDMSKLESGKFELRQEPFRMSKVLEEVNIVSEGQAAEFGICYLTSAKREIEHDQLIGSPVYLKRILLNFTSNAVKYNKANGAVYTYVKEISFDGKRAVFEFVCEDTGIGMSENYLKHAFEPFTQETRDNARTQYAGTGLGLAITKQLLELMGGTIDLTSKEEVGTKIVCRIPFEVDFEDHSEKEQIDYSSVMFDGMRVLLAEDNELNAEIATFLLELHGMDVTWVQNGQMAVDEITADMTAADEIAADKTAEAGGTYDVVFMDVMMPVMNGLEAASKIRELGSDIPIFAMTANAFTDDKKKSRAAGMNAHLTKPLVEADIVNAVLEFVK